MESRDEAWLIERLRRADAPCVGCGYSMRGLGGLTCPECGRRFSAEDLGQRSRPGWARFMLGGWGWWACVAGTAWTCVWEAAVGEPTPRWYAAVFQGRHGAGLIPTALATLLLAWGVARVWTRARAAVDPLLACAWVLLWVHLAALLVAGLLG